MISDALEKYPNSSLPQLHGRLRAEWGCSRSFDGMAYRIRKDFVVPKEDKYKYIREKLADPTMIGIKSQLDVKYVPVECMSAEMQKVHIDNGLRWYQYTIIDCCSRELFIYFYDSFGIVETIDFAHRAMAFFGYKFHELRTDNGKEFVNQDWQKKSAFEKMLNKIGTTHTRSQPRSPWQNGRIERYIELAKKSFIDITPLVIWKTCEQRVKNI